jgi:hypothetical protein
MPIAPISEEAKKPLKRCLFIRGHADGINTKESIVEKAVFEKAASAARNFIANAEDIFAADGYCPHCEASDFPVDENGERITGMNVEHASEWRIEHDTDCPVAIIGGLLASFAESESE